jgi:hypothetical protein
MSQIIKGVLLNIFTALFLYCTQVIVVYTLFYPFNQINVPLLYFTWTIIYKNKIKFFWALLIYYLLSDLFTTFSFGVAGFSAITALIFTKQFFNLFITTYNWYSIFLLGFVSFIIYQFTIFFMVYAIPLVQGKSVTYNLSGLYSSLIEICLNASVLLLTYSFIAIIKPKKRNYYTV